MLSTALFLTACCALAAPGDADPRAAIRSILTEGWEIGGFAKAWKQAESLGEARSKESVALAIAILQMRHNLYPEARKELQTLAAAGNDPMVLAALAWTEAAAGEHLQALKTFERAARSVSKGNVVQADCVFRALGTYFGFLECGDLGPEIRAAYREARPRLLGLAPETVRERMALLQAGVEQRLGKPADEGAEPPRDPAAIEAERTKALAEADKRLSLLTTEYQKQARQAALLADQVRSLQVERNKYIDNPNGKAYRELNVALTQRLTQQKEAEAKAAEVAEKARELTQFRKAVIRRYDQLLDKSKIVSAPKPTIGAKPTDGTPPHEALAKAGQFPLDVARQIALRSLLSAEDAKAVSREFRIWTNRNGGMMFVARMLRIDLDRVVLSNPMGKEASLAIIDLSHADQDFVDSTAAPPPIDLVAKSDVKVPSLPMPSDPPPVSDPTAPAKTTASLFNVKLISATWGVGDTRKDATEKFRNQLAADPFMPIQGDDRVIGDPVPGQAKTLQIKLEIDGKPIEMTLQHLEHSTLPAIPPEGVALASASRDLRIIAARYGMGMSWYDVTHLVAQRATHPGEPVAWSHMAWGDPWEGQKKSFVVWFDYGGKRFVKTFAEYEVKPLVEGVKAPVREGTFNPLIKKDHWMNSPKATKLASNERSFGVITEISGAYTGLGNEVRLSLAQDQSWQLAGVGGDPESVEALSLSTPLRDKFVRKVEEYVWAPNSKPIKMIPASEGFCVLSSMAGDFVGLGESVGVEINPKDGYWYLIGKHGGAAVSCRAIAYRLKPNSGVKLHFVEYLSRNERPIKMLHKDEGFCYLAGVAGEMRGFGEKARVVLGEDGYFELKPQNIYARAVSIRIE